MNFTAAFVSVVILLHVATAASQNGALKRIPVHHDRLQFRDSHFLRITVQSTFGTESDLACLIPNQCLDVLRKFSHADGFEVYTSLEEALSACRVTRDAYVCVEETPECRDPSSDSSLSPVLWGSRNLLGDFCGFRSRRRPCCRLREVYMEHRNCYENVTSTVNECNQKYRRSLEMILTIDGEQEQKRQRFCSLAWFGKCVKKATQDECGEKAAEVLKLYMTRAGEPDQNYLAENDKCSRIPYGFNEEISRNVCEPQCQSIFQGAFEDLSRKSGRLRKEVLFNMCMGIHDFMKCISQTFNRCNLLPVESTALEKNGMEEVCLIKGNVIKGYQKEVRCLIENFQQLSECQPENVPQDEIADVRPSAHFHNNSCRVLKQLEVCLIKTATVSCGINAERIMSDMILKAHVNFIKSCLR